MPKLWHRFIQHTVSMALQDLGYDVLIHDQTDKERDKNPFIADAVGRFKGTANQAAAAKRKRIVYVECQSPPITKEWKEKIARNYKGLNVIIIELEKFDVDGWSQALYTSHIFKDLYEAVYAQIDCETSTPGKPCQVAGEWYMDCPDPACGERIQYKQLKAHKARHWKEQKKREANRQ